MSNKARTYATALFETLLGKSAKEAEIRIVRFVALLKKHGDLKIAREVISAFRTLLKEQEGKEGILVTARPLSQKASQRMRALLDKKGIAITEEVNPAVIGGAALFVNREFLIDGTVKTKLEKIFSE